MSTLVLDFFNGLPNLSGHDTLGLLPAGTAAQHPECEFGILTHNAVKLCLFAQPAELSMKKMVLRDRIGK